ncbi:MAG TPA: hypothetical protein VNY31_10780 [Solirubrobacteraceae bacterium]|jgi:hypothetical protein|nr:hypothetical protein [Solirubrobacteraceae bacterium]
MIVKSQNIKHHASRLAGTYKRAVVVAIALAVPLATAGLASPALATPKGEFAVFADCPLSNPNVHGCIVSKTESGKFIIGKRTVPIENVITLQGGFEGENPCNFPFQGKGECRLPFVGAADGNTLSKTAQNVPGGLLNLINCKEITNKGERELCEFFFEKGITAVTATTELAAPASSIGLSEAALLNPVLSEAFGIPALQLPVKIKLSNPLFGTKCYIGSEAEPIILNLITGKTNPPKPNESITGKIGTFESNEAGDILTISHNSLVDNSFAAPGVNGCGGSFSSLLDPLIDAQLGLPSTAGHNTAILEGTLKQAGAEAVRENE